MRTITVLCLMLAMACEKQLPTFTRDCHGSSDERARFIIECTKAGNPMSDEEGEDLVAECGTQAEYLYCPMVRAFRERGQSVSYPCRLAHDKHQRGACE